MVEAVRVQEVWQLADVYEIRKETFVSGQGIPKECEFDEVYNDSYRYILVLLNNEPVATARINVRQKAFAKIERVAVKPNYQHQGFGKVAIEGAEAWIRELGYQKIVITSQEKAVGFYQRLNYEVKPEIIYESDIPIVHTEKQLTIYIP